MLELRRYKVPSCLDTLSNFSFQFFLCSCNAGHRLYMPRNECIHILSKIFILFYVHIRSLGLDRVLYIRRVLKVIKCDSLQV